MYERRLQSSGVAVILGNHWLLATLAESGFKPVEFFGQIALDITDMHLGHPVAARLQPRPPRGAVFCDGLGLIAIDQFDRNSMHERDKIRDVAADRRLPFELPGEAAIGGQRPPQYAFGIGRISPQQPRQSPHRAAFRRYGALAMLGRQRAQPWRPSP